MNQNKTIRNVFLTFLAYILFSILFSHFHYLFLNIETLEKNEYLKDFPKLSRTSFSFSNIYIIAIKELISTLLVSLLIFISLTLYNNKIHFLTLLDSIIKAKYIFLISILLEIIYLKYVLIDFTLLDLIHFSPLSLINLFDYSSVELWLIYPLQTINLFEICFVFLITYFINKKTNISKKMSFKIVATSYGSALLLWIYTVILFTLNNS